MALQCLHALHLDSTTAARINHCRCALLTRSRVVPLARSIFMRECEREKERRAKKRTRRRVPFEYLISQCILQALVRSCIIYFDAILCAFFASERRLLEFALKFHARNNNKIYL